MNDYLAVRIDMTPCTSDTTDLAAAFLADAGFESFEPDAAGLTAYIRATEAGERLAKESLEDFPIATEIQISTQVIEGEDWNAEWEKNYFKPIVVDDRCVVHSSFHTDIPDVEFDIVIDPKMAFGTGHHDTTSQMMRHILQLDMKGKNVIDMGTGTGILALLSKMLGAEEVTGIEIDRPAFENAIENARLNKCDVQYILGDAGMLMDLKNADYLFANINRNIIVEDIDKYSEKLKEGGIMLLSGFYEEDIPMILEAAGQYGLREEKRMVSDRNWAALRLRNAL